MAHEHNYKLTAVWTGNKGDGTKNVRTYDRNHKVTIQGKPELFLTTDNPAVGDKSKLNDDVILQPLPIFGWVSKRQISYQSYQLLMLRMWVCCKLAEFSTYPYSASFLNAIGVFPFRASCGLR